MLFSCVECFLFDLDCVVSLPLSVISFSALLVLICVEISLLVSNSFSQRVCYVSSFERLNVSIFLSSLSALSYLSSVRCFRRAIVLLFFLASLFLRFCLLLFCRKFLNSVSFVICSTSGLSLIFDSSFVSLRIDFLD